MEWDRLYDEIELENNNFAENATPDNQGEMTEELFADCIRRLSGFDESTGLARAELSYQAYDYDKKDDPEKDRIYTVSNAIIQISRNRMFDDLLLLDIIFKSSEDTELKLLWGRLQQHIRHQSEESEHNWIFYINLLERAALQDSNASSVLTANMFNPIMCYLTREVPNQKITDTNISNEMQGGNIIRMLIPSGLITFDLNTDIDINRIQEEIQRDIEAARYLNSIGEKS